MNARRHWNFAVLVTVMTTCALPGLVWADQAEDNNALIRSLAPIADQTIATEPVPTDLPGGTIYLVPEASVDIEVSFARNSAALTAGARDELAALGQALTSETLLPFSYLIAGHTDTAGAADYNQLLSERRAESVRDFLIETYAIDPARLVSVGWGESRLKHPDEPKAAANRRVEITLIVPPGGFPEESDLEAAVPPELPATEDTPPPGTLVTDGSGGIKIAF